VQTTALLHEVARPLVTIRWIGPEPFPDRWHGGDVFHCRSYLFGLIPLGTRTVIIADVDPASQVIETFEWDPLVDSWQHRLMVSPADGGGTAYTDVVEIKAGLLTPLVWLFARWFYRHRHKRWRAVAQRLLAEARQANPPRGTMQPLAP
jgi:hypothetical protein